MVLFLRPVALKVPPEITAQCLEGGISFSVVRPTISLWEVGIDQEPLTVDLVAQRGYRLLNDTVRTVLEVPIFSVGYTYEVGASKSLCFSCSCNCSLFSTSGGFQKCIFTFFF